METLPEDETALLGAAGPSVNTQDDSKPNSRFSRTPKRPPSASVPDVKKKNVTFYSDHQSHQPRSVSLPQKNLSPEQLERMRLLHKSTQGVYKRRWYILVVTCALSTLGGWVYNTWGPITEPAKLVFRWSNGNIALLANWTNIGYLLACLPASWMLDEKGKGKKLPF